MKINQLFLPFFLVVFFPLVSIVALLAATDAIITLSQNAIWALYVGCLLKGATHNIRINSIHQLLEPSCHNRNTCSYFLFTTAAPEPGKQKYGNSCFLWKKGSSTQFQKNSIPHLTWSKKSSTFMLHELISLILHSVTFSQNQK